MPSFLLIQLEGALGVVYFESSEYSPSEGQAHARCLKYNTQQPRQTWPRVWKSQAHVWITESELLLKNTWTENKWDQDQVYKQAFEQLLLVHTKI